MTGMTAGTRDFNDLMKERAPIVFGFVLTLAFLLLLVTFRSIVIPIKAIVLNLLSVGGRLRRPHLGLPGRATRERCWASTPTAASSAGCRCSCS